MYGSHQPVSVTAMTLKSPLEPAQGSARGVNPQRSGRDRLARQAGQIEAHVGRVGTRLVGAQLRTEPPSGRVGRSRSRTCPARGERDRVAAYGRLRWSAVAWAGAGQVREWATSTARQSRWSRSRTMQCLKQTPGSRRRSSRGPRNRRVVLVPVEPHERLDLRKVVGQLGGQHVGDPGCLGARHFRMMRFRRS